MLSDAVVTLVLALSSVVIPGAFSDVGGSKISKHISYRLPDDITPISYQLGIATNVHRYDFDYTGSVDIRLIVIKSTDRIVIHARELNIESFSLTDVATNSVFEDLDSELNKENWFLTIYSRNNSLNLRPGNEYLLKFKFNGTLGTGILDGFYRTSYKNPKNEEIWIATTQFEPTFARKVFPCYDEPQFKANFTIAISHGSNYTAISNMPTDGEPIESEDGTITTKFLQTPPMSTYNVGFVVHNYEHISATEGGIVQRVFNPSQNKDKGQYALEVAQKTLKAMAEYFNVSYPLPKLDHIVVSKRYGEAMENWGLIIYKPYALVSSSSTLNKENLKDTEVVAHEVVHQWFGNLVTMKWWNYLWLNEGIATYFGNKALKMIYPEHHVADYDAAMRFESCWRFNNVAITKNVETEKQIKHAFNPATYEKAAYVIQMFEHTFTEEIFREALSLFLHKFQYSVADEDDFFQCLQEVTSAHSLPFFKENGKVKAVMYNWFHKKSYPVVTVVRNYENGTFTLKQEPDSKSEENTFWYIPITVTMEGDPEAGRTTPDLIFPPTKELLVDGSIFNKQVQPQEWIVLNKKQVGIYRINYDERNWELIIAALKRNPRAVPPHNRAQLLRDSVHFLLNNHLNASVAFHLLSYLKREDEIFPWCEGNRVLKQILFEVEDSVIYEQYKRFIGDVIAIIFDTIESTLLEGRLSLTECINDIFELACLVEYERCLKYAKNNYNVIVKQRVALNKDLAKLIICEGIKIASEDEYLAAFKTLSLLSDSEERSELIDCLAQNKEVDLVNFLLNSTLEDNEVFTPKDRSNVIYSTSKNPIAVLDTIQFLKKNHMKLENITNELWTEISFLRHNVRTEEEKEEYLVLLKEVKHLGSIDYESPDELFKKDYPDFLDGQEDNISQFLDGYFERNSNNLPKLMPISLHAILALELTHYFIGMFINPNFLYLFKFKYF